MNKDFLIESLDKYRSDIILKSSYGSLVEYTSNQPMYQDIISGRSEHEHERDKISINPFKRTKVGSANVELVSDKEIPDAFYNKAKGGYKLNKTKEAKNDSKDPKQKENIADAGIRFKLFDGFPVLIYGEDTLSNISKVDVSKLPEELCVGKLTNNDATSIWTRDDISRLKRATFRPAQLPHVIVNTNHLNSTNHPEKIPIAINESNIKLAIAFKLFMLVYTEHEALDNPEYMEMKPTTEQMHSNANISAFRSGNVLYVKFINEHESCIFKLNHTFTIRIS